MEEFDPHGCGQQQGAPPPPHPAFDFLCLALFGLALFDLRAQGPKFMVECIMCGLPALPTLAPLTCR